jgi:hypothetical protein
MHQILKKNSEKFAKGFSVADSKSLFGGIDMRGRASNNSPFCAISLLFFILARKRSQPMLVVSLWVDSSGTNMSMSSLKVTRG